MKSIITAIIITAATATASLAQDAQDPCQSAGDLAQVIMERRQDGTPMSTLMNLIQGNEIARLMIVEAYKVPRMAMPANQRREVEDFRNMMEMVCYNAG